MIVVIIALVVAVVGLAAVGMARIMGSRRSEMREPPLALSGELRDRVRALLAEGRDVQAVKEVRQATGVGLVTAKQLVDALQDGSPPRPGR